VVVSSLDIRAIFSDFAIMIEREELLYVVWCLARGILAAIM
jgi:hypothetical protein